MRRGDSWPPTRGARRRRGANAISRRPRHRSATRSSAVALAVLVGLALCLSLLTSRSLFPLYSLNHDEPMYVLQAKMLRQGHLTLPAKHAEFVRPWAAGVRGGRIVMKYAPPWPAVIAIGETLFGSRHAAPALTYATAVLLVYGLSFELFRSRRAAILTAGLLLLSPVAILQSGTVLPYLFQLTLELAFAVLLLSGMRTGSNRRLVLAGAALGVAVFARPADALLFAAPFAVLLASTHLHSLRALVRRAGLVAAGAAPPLCTALLYNFHTMGSPWRPPYNVTGRYDTFGFGRRGTFDDNTFHYGPHAAVRALDNLWSLPGWSFGGIVLVALAVIGLATSRPIGSRAWAVAAVTLTIPAGYFFFWSPFTMAHVFPGLASLGPYYHVPVIVPLVVFAGRGLDRLPLDRWRGTGVEVTVMGGLAAVMVAITAATVPPKISRNVETTDDLRAASKAIPVAKLGRAVVFLAERPNEGAASRTPFLQDELPLTGRVVFASDLGPPDIDFLDRMPTRVPYRLDAALPPGAQLFSPTLELTRITRSRGALIVVHAVVRSPSAGSCLTAYETAGSGEELPTSKTVILDRASSAGESYEAVWTFARPRSAGVLPASTVLAVGEGYLRVGVAVGPTCDPRASELYEQRFAFRSERSGLHVLAPGYGWHQLHLRGRRPFWVRAQVDPILDRVVVRADSAPLTRMSAPRR